jgi:polysaccharide deacetylase family protein (PEP-CTERM system associated)
MKNMQIASLTVDVEDGINISMRDNFQVEMEPTGRVEDNMEIILEICERNKVRATFFILGEIAEKFPELIKRVGAAGHEIGVHGYHHDQIFKLTPDKLKADLGRAKALMEDLSGQEIRGFRAPAFSINQKTSWALPLIADCGFSYDSSIFPSLSLRYGWKDFSKNICRIDLGDSSSLVEVPLSVIHMLGRDIPVGGGGYLRYFPYGFTRRALQRISRERSPVIYLHPYELDTKRYPDFYHEAIARSPFKKRMYLSLYRFKKDTVKSKLDRITSTFEFLPLKDIIDRLEENKQIPSITLEQ